MHYIVVRKMVPALKTLTMVAYVALDFIVSYCLSITLLSMMSCTALALLQEFGTFHGVYSLPSIQP